MFIRVCGRNVFLPPCEREGYVPPSPPASVQALHPASKPWTFPTLYAQDGAQMHGKKFHYLLDLFIERLRAA